MTFRTRNIVALGALGAVIVLSLGAIALSLVSAEPPEPTPPLAEVMLASTPKPSYFTIRESDGGPVYGYEIEGETAEVIYGVTKGGIRVWLIDGATPDFTIFMADTDCKVGSSSKAKRVESGFIGDRTIRAIAPGSPLFAMCEDAKAGLLTEHDALAGAASV